MKVIGQSLTQFRDTIDFNGDINIGSSSSLNKAELSYTLSSSELSIFDIKTYSGSTAPVISVSATGQSTSKLRAAT